MMVSSSIQGDKTEQGPGSSKPPEVLAMISKSFQTKAHIATEIFNTYFMCKIIFWPQDEHITILIFIGAEASYILTNICKNRQNLI